MRLRGIRRCAFRAYLEVRRPGFGVSSCSFLSFGAKASVALEPRFGNLGGQTLSVTGPLVSLFSPGQLADFALTPCGSQLGVRSALARRPAAGLRRPGIALDGARRVLNRSSWRKPCSPSRVNEFQEDGGTR